MGSSREEFTTSAGAWLTRFLAVHIAAEIWVWAALGKFGVQVGVWADLLSLEPPIDPTAGWIAALLFSAVAVLSFRPGRERLAAGLQAALLASMVVYFFPNVPNHFFAFGIALGLCAFCEPDREGELLTMSLRSVAALIFFDAGIQKILYAGYFQGSVLAFMIAQAPNFNGAFGWVLPAAEMEQLHSAVPNGPFRLTSWIGLAIANLTWLSEIVLPIGLLFRRTRVPAALGAIVLVVAIQVAAREVFFAGFMVPTLLLWISPSLAVRSIPFVWALDAYLVLAGFGVFPYFGAI